MLLKKLSFSLVMLLLFISGAQAKEIYLIDNNLQIKKINLEAFTYYHKNKIKKPKTFFQRHKKAIIAIGLLTTALISVALYQKSKTSSPSLNSSDEEDHCEKEYNSAIDDNPERREPLYPVLNTVSSAVQTPSAPLIQQNKAHEQEKLYFETSQPIDGIYYDENGCQKHSHLLTPQSTSDTPHLFPMMDKANSYNPNFYSYNPNFYL